MKSIAKLNLQNNNNNSNATTSSSSSAAASNLTDTCIFSQCKLKSVEGYNFCYQHVYAAATNSKKKKIMCSFKSNNYLDKCNQYVLIPNAENLCTFHMTQSSLKKCRSKSGKDDESEGSSTEKYKLIDETSIDSKTILNEQILTNKPTTSKEGGDGGLISVDEEANSDVDDGESDMSSIIDVEENSNPDEPDYEDALEHASVYTQEEIMKIFKIKLKKLQYLYKKQLKMLNDRMKYDRKVYLMLKKSEIEKYGTNYKINVKNQAQKELLKAAKKYRTKSSFKTYLKEKYEEKHKKESLNEQQKQEQLQCIFTENDVKCGKKPIPLSKYCLNHILNDQNQILFSECGGDDSNGSESTCKVPVVESITPKCRLHMSNKIIEELKTLETNRKENLIESIKEEDDEEEEEEDEISNKRQKINETNDQETVKNDVIQKPVETNADNCEISNQEHEEDEGNTSSSSSASSESTNSSSNTSTGSSSSTSSSSSSSDSETNTSASSVSSNNEINVDDTDKNESISNKDSSIETNKDLNLSETHEKSLEVENNDNNNKQEANNEENIDSTDLNNDTKSNEQSQNMDVDQ